MILDSCHRWKVGYTEVGDYFQFVFVISNVVNEYHEGP